MEFEDWKKKLDGVNSGLIEYHMSDEEVGCFIWGAIDGSLPYDGVKTRLIQASKVPTGWRFVVNPVNDTREVVSKFHGFRRAKKVQLDPPPQQEFDGEDTKTSSIFDTLERELPRLLDLFAKWLERKIVAG